MFHPFKCCCVSRLKSLASLLPDDLQPLVRCNTEHKDQFFWVYLHHLGSLHWYPDIQQTCWVFLSASHWGSSTSAGFGTSWLGGHLPDTSNCFTFPLVRSSALSFSDGTNPIWLFLSAFGGCHDSTSDCTPSLASWSFHPPVHHLDRLPSNL